MPVAGLPFIVIGLIPFAFVGANTSYVILCAGNFVQGLGMGMAMMPTMTAAMQAVPLSAIARTSTAMNIIRQAGASVGTAVLSVILATEIKDNITAGSSAHSGSSLSSIQHLSAADRAHVVAPLAHAFATTFVWAAALVAVALVPALSLALLRRRQAAQRSSDGELAPMPLVSE